MQNNAKEQAHSAVAAWRGSVGAELRDLLGTAAANSLEPEVTVARPKRRAAAFLASVSMPPSSPLFYSYLIKDADD